MDNSGLTEDEAKEITNYSVIDYILLTGAAGSILYLLISYLAAELGIGIF